MIIHLDTNILTRMFHRPDPQYLLVRNAVRVLQNRGDLLVASPQNVAEFWSVCTRPVTSRGGLGLSLVATSKRLRLIERVTNILPYPENTFQQWKQLVSAHGVKGLQVYDAKIVVHMVSNRTVHLLTLIHVDFTRYFEITVLNPTDIASLP